MSNPEDAILDPTFKASQFATELQDVLHLLRTVCERHNVPAPDVLGLTDGDDYAKFITTVNYTKIGETDVTGAVRRIVGFEIQRTTSRVRVN